MKYIAHRINTIAELEKVPPDCGVELDLRDYGDRLILQHEPFEDGQDFEDYLKKYHHGTMILNIKSERIEFRVLELLEKYNVTDYFFLDSSFAMIFQLMQAGDKNIALHFSEYERMETLLTMKGKAKWVWVDCFTQLPIDRSNFTTLKEAGYQLCLVSPELLGRPEDIEPYRQYLKQEGISFDAVCTKKHHLEKWGRK